MTSPDGKGSSARGITRRDFVHDVTLASLALALPLTGQSANAGAGSAGSGNGNVYYPPTRTGLRGAHEGSFEVAHQLAREGKVFDAPRVLDEHYDLVVVGGGISGLAAAYFYRREYGADKRVLILDNHDDFGGHAKRNEFHQAGPMRLAWGGTVNIEYPEYSAVGLQLFAELGIDIPRLLEDFTFNWGDSASGLRACTWFDRQTYGRDVLIPGLSLDDSEPSAIASAVPRFPLSAAAKDALMRFLTSGVDVLPGLSPEEKAAFAARTRYADFLRDYCDLPDEAIQIFSGATMGGWGVRADDLSVQECLESGLPGAHVLGLPGAEEGGGYASEKYAAAMFPDGNASIARLLVRALIPAAFPDMEKGSDPFSVVTAELDYGQLDPQPSPAGAADVRLRLNATVVGVRNTAGNAAVDVTYMRDGEVLRVSGDHCVLACYNRIIPHLCPELPEAQKAGLQQCIKRPMVTINVLLRDGRALQKSGVSHAYLPGRIFQLVTLVSGINVGNYRNDFNPEEPCVLHFFAAVGAEQPEGLTISQQNQAGRLRLLQMPYEAFEAEVFTVLQGIWGAAGLDPERDIEAITVNRWPHGYARDLLQLEDPAWLASPGPYETGRQPCGNIAIANSDSGADAYTHTAIDQAWRAINELPTAPAPPHPEA